MTDTGSSSLPPGASPPRSRPQTPTVLGLVTGRVAAIAQALTQRIQATTINGVVVGQNKDGSTKIRTAEGDVDVVLRGRDSLPPGTQVEVTIPPARADGQPPRQVSVLEVAPRPDQPAPPAKPDTPQQTTTTVTKPATPIASPHTGDDAAIDGAIDDRPRPAPIITRPSLPPELRETLDQTQQPRPVATPTPAPLQPDVIIRLVPLPAAQLHDLVLPVAEDVILPAPVIRASVVPQDIAKDIAQTLAPAFPATKPVAIKSVSPIAITTLPPVGEMPVATSAQRPVAMPAQSTFYTVPVAPPAISSAAIPSTSIPPTALPGMTMTPLPQGSIWPAPLFPQSQPGMIQVSMPQSMPTGPNLITPQAQAIPPLRPHTMDARITAIHPGEGIARLTPMQSAQSIITPDATIPVLHNPNPITTRATIIGHMPTQNNPVAVLHAPLIAPNQLFAIQWAGDAPMTGMTLDLLPRSVPVPLPGVVPDGTSMPAPGVPVTTAPIMAGMTPPSILFADWDWPAMDDMIQTLSVTAPQVAAATARMVPNAASPSQAGAAMMFLFAAIRANDVAGWLGDDAISALRRDPRGMQALTRMGRDIAGLQKTDADPVTQDWKALTLPMMWQNDIHKIHMFYRRQHSDQDDDSSDAKKGDSTRFIFDLNLDRMGDMQIDGLMKDKRLDLILRTREKSFSPPMQAHMKGLYVAALENAGMKGALGFQSRSEDWVRVDVRRAEVQESA
ncbi:hypothetical protein [Micavibrio aeruginosavorus]|uniref:Uncharacterized protein n=1 Tax=Micavibrio aeruginosavorus EPB TaxID=349215 RepID=M4VWD7_9BACT|nr:hypothetical protein [Micavibrio aeruginosavorus]AGH97489.1 hypothetical protein A11S_665 [Micavibrio aeruginosavorus EPB]